ncbi:uncharacterized protein LOC123546183 [Mercenaria mercenaria]|uniref:uncharacterized protein LOC123546183 n=1 Tax=Mercenaria mercenaria TaxID=6596 RepID=UPI00234F3C55|nr:uncharacterized protein LOC123546183 [Mercenaria mercenaria]
MFRVTVNRRSKSKNGGVITTHCDDNSSNTEIGNRVFANFNSSSQSLSTRSPLTQRNNDYMKFSWDPMQVVNIPRQQKAVCNREIEKLRGLERYFSRQTHLEAYKQSNQIDKVRARLVRLNKLRMSTGNEEKHTEARAFPIYNPLTQQCIGKTPTLNDQTSRFKSSEKIDYSDIPIHSEAFDKKQILYNNGYNYRGVNNEKKKNYSSGLKREHLTGTAKLPILSRQADSNFQIKACQDTDYHSTPRYQKLYKRLKSYETTKWGVNKVDNNCSSGMLTVADSELTRRNVNNTLDSFTSPKKKTVRFNRQEREDISATQLPSRKYSQLVKLANNVSDL